MYFLYAKWLSASYTSLTYSQGTRHNEHHTSYSNRAKSAFHRIPHDHSHFCLHTHIHNRQFGHAFISTSYIVYFIDPMISILVSRFLLSLRAVDESRAGAVSQLSFVATQREQPL